MHLLRLQMPFNFLFHVIHKYLLYSTPVNKENKQFFTKVAILQKIHLYYYITQISYIVIASLIVNKILK